MIVVITISQEFNKLTAQNFAARLAQTNLAIKSGIAALVKHVTEIFLLVKATF